MTAAVSPNEYPKYLFKAGGEKTVVKDAEAHKLLGEGWYDSPGEAAEDQATAPAPAAAPTKQDKADAKAADAKK